MSDPAVVVDGVSKRFRMYRERTRSLKQAVLQRRRATFEEFWALKDVSFEIPQGSTFGLIGENGSGKSTLLKCVAKILRPDTGGITTHGRVAALLELGSGFHPELSGRENVYLNGSILGLSRREIDKRLDEIVDFAGVEAFIDQPVKNYSSGMYVRLGFSVAINVDPDILLVDEVLAVGDASFQQKCMEKFADYRRAGRTVVVVSHAMGSLRNFCDTVAWLEHGRLQAVGPAGSVVDDYVDETHADRKVSDAAGADDARWGSGEIRVERVELLDASGGDTRTLRTGDDVVVRLHYRAEQSVERPVFGLGITTLEGHDVTGPNTRDTGRSRTRWKAKGTSTSAWTDSPCSQVPTSSRPRSTTTPASTRSTTGTAWSASTSCPARPARASGSCRWAGRGATPSPTDRPRAARPPCGTPENRESGVPRTVHPLINESFDRFARYQHAESVRAVLGAAPIDILDVGDPYGTLDRLFPDDRTVSADVYAEELPPRDRHAHVLASGFELPFPEDSFDLVTCHDTLEHVPLERKTELIAELLRVSRGPVLVVAPFADPRTSRCEEMANAYYVARLGYEMYQLTEHAASGLPDLGEVLDLGPRTGAGLPAAFRRLALPLALVHDPQDPPAQRAGARCAPTCRHRFQPAAARRRPAAAPLPPRDRAAAPGRARAGGGRG